MKILLFAAKGEDESDEESVDDDDNEIDEDPMLQFVSIPHDVRYTLHVSQTISFFAKMLHVNSSIFLQHVSTTRREE